ncbi:hypothetical protein K435DRAFT_780260 [Dendrothele bispora CBS 962.96]|uniref:Uncharacterized protein n=1 Tax=Dendrothele bispora (strain CBS 962.96) TaxID=1314807 RepID=A0A4V4HEU6_DENBC|nr:hypothetical protein K435DRAFT_780260 [Dendrothele bispora CBS 962.96]
MDGPRMSVRPAYSQHISLNKRSLFNHTSFWTSCHQFFIKAEWDLQKDSNSFKMSRNKKPWNLF